MGVELDKDMATMNPAHAVYWHPEEFIATTVPIPYPPHPTLSTSSTVKEETKRYCGHICPKMYLKQVLLIN